MKRKLLVFVLFTLFGFAANAEMVPDSYLKKTDTVNIVPPNYFDTTGHIGHWSIADTFFGDERDYEVCYPKAHRKLFVVIFALAFTIAVFGGLIIYLKVKHNKRLKLTNEIIEEKNKDLMDSINYAKKIQNSILPNCHGLTEILPQSFIYYKPKDVVSGDFYWYKRVGNRIFVLAGDCTGHGVPGALLTVIGLNAIAAVVNENAELSPSEILDRMNSLVKIALNQTQNSGSNDAMEVALCVIDTNADTLSYAGATLALLCLEDGKITSIKGEKCSIGSVQDHIQEPPKTHVINGLKNKTFYMHSDGIVDQFGGKDGKKLKSSAFKAYLESTVNVEFTSQENKLDVFLNNWKGSIGQVDDITVIGFRI